MNMDFSKSTLQVPVNPVYQNVRVFFCDDDNCKDNNIKDGPNKDHNNKGNHNKYMHNIDNHNKDNHFKTKKTSNEILLLLSAHFARDSGIWYLPSLEIHNLFIYQARGV